MIPYLNIEPMLISALDAEGSDRYNFDDDYKPAINYAIDFSISVFNAIFSQNKKSEEILKELVLMRMWKLSKYSRFAFDETTVGCKLWSVLSIIPKADLDTSFNYTSFPDNQTEGQYLKIGSETARYLGGGYPCKRLTTEQWIEKDRNPFMAGNPFNICEDTIQYGYIAFADYVGGFGMTKDKFEIEIAPHIPNELVAMRFLKKPVSITTNADNI